MTALDGPAREAIVAGSFVPVSVAAKRLGLQRNAVYRLMDDGALAFLRAVGRHRRARRVSVVSLDHFIAQNLIVQ